MLGSPCPRPLTDPTPEIGYGILVPLSCFRIPISMSGIYGDSTGQEDKCRPVLQGLYSDFVVICFNRIPSCAATLLSPNKFSALIFGSIPSMGDRWFSPACGSYSRELCACLRPTLESLFSQGRLVVGAP